VNKSKARTVSHFISFHPPLPCLHPPSIFTTAPSPCARRPVMLVSVFLAALGALAGFVTAQVSQITRFPLFAPHPLFQSPAPASTPLVNKRFAYNQIVRVFCFSQARTASLTLMLFAVYSRTRWTRPMVLAARRPVTTCATRRLSCRRAS
jgi:hypothetical protein